MRVTKKPGHGDWPLRIEAVAWMGLARMAVLSLPFRFVMRACGSHMAESPRSLTQTEATVRDEVANAVNTMRLFTPWDSNCLAQAIAGSRMLQRRGIPTTTYLGVARENEDLLEAHAWLRCGDKIITGDNQLSNYTQIASFATEGRREEL